MLTIFEKIPELFVEVYNPQFQTWAREFQRRGSKVAIVFNRRPGVPPLLDGDGREILAGAWFTAEVDRSRPSNVRVIIRPASEHDAEMVEKHVRELAPHVLQ